MVRLKNTKRKQPGGLPLARFPVVATGRAERDRHYMVKFHLLPQTEELDWTGLTPLLPGAASPKLERAVERINEEHANPPPQNMEEVFKLVQDLHANPPTSPATETDMNEDPALLTPHIEVEEEASVPSPSPPTLTSETVPEVIRPPLLLAKRAMATLVPCKGRPNPPNPPPPPHCSCQVPMQGVPATQ